MKMFKIRRLSDGLFSLGGYPPVRWEKWERSGQVKAN